jgi:arylsulfatase A-like enzyme
MRLNVMRVWVSVLCVIVLLSVGTRGVARDRPNIIYVLADDLGYGDLSCYGQTTLMTPNLDKMAAEGMRFTQHYAGSTVCAPSRCVLMTGLHTGHATVRGNGPSQLTGKDLTFATLLQKAGYKTGGFGKWGIGNPPPLDDPNRHGFDEFYGYVNMFHAHNFFPEFMIRNGQYEYLSNKVPDEYKGDKAREGRGVALEKVEYAPFLIRDEMLKFIRKNHREPFFVYYALNIPHANNEGGRVGRGMEVPDHGAFRTTDWPEPEKGFAQMIRYIDRDMGTIFNTLKELGVDDNTIVFFSSDNGPHQEGGHLSDFFNSNGDLRGIKRDLYEGGIRVPLIARWPGKVEAGAVSGHVSGFQDMLATVCELAGLKAPKTDGVSMAPTLLGQERLQPRHDYLYWEFLEKGGRRAILKDGWKGVALNTLKTGLDEFELYRVGDDIGEENNLAKKNPKVVEELKGLMEKAHVNP